MIASMTGFGKSIVTFEEKMVKTEVRSLNSKNLDLTIKLPMHYKEKENVLRNMLSSRLERGKIDLVITIDGSASGAGQMINAELVKEYFQQIRSIADEVGVVLTGAVITDLLKLPDALKPTQEDISPDEWIAVENSVNEAIIQLEEFRRSEGNHLFDDIMGRINIIAELLQSIDPFEKQRLETIRERILKSLNDLSENIKTDENRFEQELIYYLEKLDITEEKVRLSKHLEYFSETIGSDGTEGKKLGFIAQEIGREINTIGSKANDATIQRVVVQMKDELEKIKEQLMNVL